MNFNQSEKEKWASILEKVHNKKEKEKEKEKELDPVDQDELEGDHDDREDKDIDNDGDVDSSDEYLHKRRKAVKKAIAKEEAEWPVYKRIMENRAERYKSATEPQKMDDIASQGAKDFVDQHGDRQPEDYVDINKVVDMNKKDMIKGLPKKSQNRPNDNKTGQTTADTPAGKDKL